MGIQFQKFKKIRPTDRPMLVKQGRVKGNKNIFKVGLIFFQLLTKLNWFLIASVPDCCFLPIVPKLALCILMDSSFWFDTINLG